MIRNRHPIMTEEDVALFRRWGLGLFVCLGTALLLLIALATLVQ